jgi:hypothetical protein
LVEHAAIEPATSAMPDLLALLREKDAGNFSEHEYRFLDRCSIGLRMR